MLRRAAMFMALIGYFLFSITTVAVQADEHDDDTWVPTIVYSDLEGCADCAEVKRAGVLEGLEAEGIVVIVYDVNRDSPMTTAYFETYGVKAPTAAPIIYAGSEYFHGHEKIVAAYESGLLAELAQQPLLDVSDFVPREFGFWIGLAVIILAGLVDGINPCAIAMLLMFISMIGFTKDRRVLMTVSVTYIGSIFVTYLIIGLGFFALLGLTRDQFEFFSYFLYGGFALLCLVLFILTFYDFIVTRKQDYGKVKNQLPKFIQAFNKRVMHRFTQAIEDEEPGLKQVLLIVFVPLILGVIVGITEAACTGQVYFTVLTWVRSVSPGTGISPVELLYIVVFNFMFIVPLILIAAFAVRARSVVGIANFIREHLSVIKLITALFFLLMTVYFVLLLAGVEIFNINIDIQGIIER
ncbi:MAG: hypothetical protein EA374_05815 [Acholeplasmatales bacterium]|nr:MAG: hypothetical protein EA374_05815 [Acholeplasmatales bacterium]